MNTQHPEKVKILNDKLEVMDFLRRLKAAFDEDLGLKPDVFLEKMNIEYDKSSLIRSGNGKLEAVPIEGIKTGVKAIDSTSKQSTLGRRGDSIRYDIFQTDQGDSRYAFHLRIPDSICLAVEDIESVLGKLELYVIDFRGSLDSKGRPAKLSPRDYWQFISVLRHPVLRGQQWMLKYSYENEDSPQPRCLETLTVINPEEPFDPILWKYRLFKN